MSEAGGGGSGAVSECPATSNAGGAAPAKTKRGRPRGSKNKKSAAAQEAGGHGSVDAAATSLKAKGSKIGVPQGQAAQPNEGHGAPALLHVVIAGEQEEGGTDAADAEEHDD